MWVKASTSVREGGLAPVPTSLIASNLATAPLRQAGFNYIAHVYMYGQ